ncbi:hypothetical protein CTI12_AA318310 [Artemisia annua]|uniref:Uncharacterized protein n=1 Tax=Artemisia annua TaxID=35608 RepID=A0A2U1N1V0_ARTAN|nr:hypothetical protein CTI12_AA318310 [Artemisia annua]
MDDLAIEIMVRNQQLVGLGVIYAVTAWLIHSRAKKRKQIFKKRNITSRSKKRKLDRVDTSTLKVMGSLQKVVEAIKRSDALLKEHKAILERSQRVYTEEEILNELELMGVKPDVKSSACRFLMEDPKKARILCGCPRDIQMSILTELMGRSG